MIRMTILTTTRAEYGLMRPLIKRMNEDPDIEMHLVVTGMHLAETYGMTWKEIEADGFPIYKKIPILSDKEGVMGVSETMANALVKFTQYFLDERPDFLLVDGDRYETMAVCVAAYNTNVPIVHCGGGATTEGSADEFYRHAITKMSYLHFPTTEVYRKRIIQMGEDPDRVFTVGSMGIENILNTKLMTKEELESNLNFSLDRPYALVTFHPVTLDNRISESQIMELFDACDQRNDLKFIFTGSNSDTGGKELNKLLTEYACNSKERVLYVQSLGSLRYLSAMKYCAFVLGNSSSGLIEAPSFKIPTVNIGDRQRGRIKAKSVIDCDTTKQSILDAIDKAMSEDFKKLCSNVINPNGDGDTTNKIVEIVKGYCINHKIDLRKKFFDL